MLSAEFFPLGTLMTIIGNWKCRATSLSNNTVTANFHANAREKDAILHTTIDRTYMTSNSKSLEQESKKF